MSSDDQGRDVGTSTAWAADLGPGPVVPLPVDPALLAEASSRVGAFRRRRRVVLVSGASLPAAALAVALASGGDIARLTHTPAPPAAPGVSTSPLPVAQVVIAPTPQPTGPLATATALASALPPLPGRSATPTASPTRATPARVPRGAEGPLVRTSRDGDTSCEIVASVGVTTNPPNTVNEDYLCIESSVSAPARGRGTVLSITACRSDQSTAPDPVRFPEDVEADLVVRHKGDPADSEVWRWSHDRKAVNDPHELAMPAGRCWTWSYTWDRTDSRGRSLPTGEYVLTGEVRANNPMRSPTEATFRA